MSKTERLFHPRTLVIHPDFKNLEEFIVSIPERFQRKEGTVIHQGRNELRKMEYNGKEYVIKSFHSPHLINRFVYGIFRPSKAKRSYDHAEMLLKIGVGTPQPVGYMNIRSGLLFDKSYYISLLSAWPYIYDNLFTQQFDYAEEVFRAIGKVTARLHEHGYAHKDYGRANILFQKTPNGITIEIVDLNRMYIGPIDMKTGCKNFERLPATPQMHRWMAEEYAKARNFDVDKCFELGNGDMALGVCRGVKAGVVDVPFAPCRANAGQMLPARDNEGAVRIMNIGNLPFDKELRDFHAAKMAQRANEENRKVSFQMVIDDVYAIGKGRLVGRPRY